MTIDMIKRIEYKANLDCYDNRDNIHNRLYIYFAAKVEPFTKIFSQ